VQEPADERFRSVDSRILAHRIRQQLRAARDGDAVLPEFLAGEQARVLRIGVLKGIENADGQDGAAHGVEAQHDDRALDRVDFPAHAQV